MKPSHAHLVQLAGAAACAALLLVSPRASWADDEADEQTEETEEQEDVEDESEEAEEPAEEDEEDEEAVKAKKKKKKKESKARLLVPVSEEGAVVMIDGEEVGTTPIKPITGLTVGGHQIEVQKEGYNPYISYIEIPDSGTVRHDVSLKGGKKKHKKVKLPKFMKTWWFWTAVGAVVVTGTTVGIAVAAQPEEPDAIHFPPY